MSFPQLITRVIGDWGKFQQWSKNGVMKISTVQRDQNCDAYRRPSGRGDDPEKWINVADRLALISLIPLHDQCWASSLGLQQSLDAPLILGLYSTPRVELSIKAGLEVDGEEVLPINLQTWG